MMGSAGWGAHLQIKDRRMLGANIQQRGSLLLAAALAMVAMWPLHGVVDNGNLGHFVYVYLLFEMWWLVLRRCCCLDFEH
jgi:hypothetical protein